MAEGFPATTGDIFTAADYNGLVAFTIGAAQTADYTAVIADTYQVLELMNKATAIAYKIPTNASVAFPIGTVLNILNIGAGACTTAAAVVTGALPVRADSVGFIVALEPRMNKITADKTGAASGKDHIGWIILK